LSLRARLGLPMEWRHRISSNHASNLHVRLPRKIVEVALERFERVPLYARFTIGHIALRSARHHGASRPKGAVP
jgi:hypothetical protein